MTSTSPTVVDLFAGAGLFSLAFRQVGFRLIRAIEADSIAAETYAANLGRHIEVADVTKASHAGKCDVLIAGPPCQGFSTLGHRRSSDPRNALSLSVVDWVSSLRPSVVVVENVEAFLHSRCWAKLNARLVRLGYSVSAFALNAYDFGCPQTRTRSFTVATFDGIDFSPPTPRRRIRTVRQAWDGLPRTPTGRNLHYAPTPSEIALARMKVIPRGGDKRDIMRNAPTLTPPSWWRTQSEVTDAWGRMRWDAPCNTLRTCLQNPSKGRYIHPTQNRVISLREAARLHSIPDNYTFTGLPTQVARQIGNSVPPSLGRAIARSAFRCL